MVKLIKLEDSLEWPDQELELVTVQCVGKAFLDYQALVAAGDDVDVLPDDNDQETPEDTDSPLEEDSSPEIDLFGLSEKALEKIDYYQVLHLPFKPQLTPDDVKKAYRKACLKYHPDKSGRGEEDAVFLKVKAAFETLSTQKHAYDSTEMPFDEFLPDENPRDFYAEFNAAFVRNLHFDARLLPGYTNGNKKGKNNRRKSRTSQTKTSTKPPRLGDSSTSIDEVHEFYDYWTHFTSWRDFSLQAARELETQEHLENAESRFEKRWYQKEIDRRAKKLKQQEQARITTLVERAMAIDPRLIQERKRLVEEKEERQRQREQEAQDKKRKEIEAKIAEERRIQEEKEQKAQEKVLREKEKKMMRKTKQAFRRLVGEALAALMEREFALDEEVDTICSKLTRDRLTALNTKLGSMSSDPGQVMKAVKDKAHKLENNIPDDDEEVESPKQNGSANTSSTPAEASPAPAPTPAAQDVKPKKIPFTKEEMSALAKAVKKYPPGGANRWDQIAHYINNVCQPQNPRTKEDCIETFNQNKTTNKPKAATSTPTTVATSTPATNTNDEAAWTEEQDKALQEALLKFPATLDKNERWTSIAKSVPGRTKKQCVNRFKAIRDAIKNKK